jgi:lysophospholipase L1-like esterase
MKRILWALLACTLLGTTLSRADLPFRNHRYDIFNVLTVDTTHIVFIGNSITNMHEWWEAFDNPKILNRGVSGAVSDETVAHLDPILAGHPAKAFLMIGTNDLGTQGINNAAHVAKNVRIILTRFKRESPTTQLYVQSILPSRRRSLPLQLQTNDSIQQICAETGATYIDLWNSFLSLSQPNNTELTLDGLHLKASGYRIWCNLLAPYVGSPCVYPADAVDQTAGLQGSLGMRASYFGMSQVKDSDILIIGDQMIHGGEWHELLHSAKVKSRGTGWGYPQGGMNNILAELPVILKGRPDNSAPAQIYLYIGAAEVNGTTDIATLTATYKNIVQQIRALAPATPIYLLSLLPTSNATTNTHRVVAFNNSLRALANSGDIPQVNFIDCYTPMVQNDVGNPKYFVGNYLYGAGYVRLAQILARNIGNAVPEPQYEVFPTLTTRDLPYRIPALAKAHNGDLIAVADYRYCRSDIGAGEIDLRGRISHDNGATWDSLFTIVKGRSIHEGNLNTGYGDPCIVADRTSDRVLLLSGSGDILFPYATRSHHLGIARFYSEDNGRTWSRPVDISEPLYQMFDKSKAGAVKSMFIGSGRIFQSATVKVGKYYRLYCSNLCKDEGGANKNYVLYSDDFGASWKVLGGVDTPPIPNKGDEPKTEELPNGSILVSSRVGGGRLFNIFTFSNPRKGKGSWGTMAFSGKANNGVAAESASCNGEVLIVPALRRSDNRSVSLILQSLPMARNRSHVGIAYKELLSPADYASPVELAKEWTGHKIVTPLGSAYSTMILQSDHLIGFLYEEETHCTTRGGGYTIVYKPYSLEQITDGKYIYNATTSVSSKHTK